MTRDLTLIVGVGSRMRGDDSVGPYVIDLMKDRMDDEGCPDGNPLSLIDADAVPENFTRPIRESGARTCILVDAVDISLEPGVLRQVPLDLIDETIPCSHSLPLSYLMKYIGEKIDEVLLIGVQIDTTGLFQEMTEDVRKGGEALSDILWEGNWKDIKVYEKGEGPSDKEATNYCW
jgi:hydrogenase 3 maturation protease